MRRRERNTVATRKEVEEDVSEEDEPKRTRDGKRRAQDLGEQARIYLEKDKLLENKDIMGICTMLLGLVYLGLLPSSILDLKPDLIQRKTLQISLFLQVLAFLFLAYYTIYLFTHQTSFLQMGWTVTVFCVFGIMIASILVALGGAFGVLHWVFILSLILAVSLLLEALWCIRLRFPRTAPTATK